MTNYQEFDDASIMAEIRRVVSSKRPQPAILQTHLQGLARETASPPSAAPTPPVKEEKRPEAETKAPETAAVKEQPKKKDDTSHTARTIRQLTYAMHLHDIMEPYVGKCGGRPEFMGVMGEIYEEYNFPDDPMAKMAIQKMVFFHELIPVLHRRAMESPSIEVAKTYFNAAHRMTEDYHLASEQLRSILADIAERSSNASNPEAKPSNQQAVILEHPQKQTKKKTG